MTCKLSQLLGADIQKDKGARSLLRTKVPGLSDSERERGQAWEQQMRRRYSEESQPQSSGSGRHSGELTSAASWSNRCFTFPLVQVGSSITAFALLQAILQAAYRAQEQALLSSKYTKHVSCLVKNLMPSGTC